VRPDRSSKARVKRGGEWVGPQQALVGGEASAGKKPVRCGVKENRENPPRVVPKRVTGWGWRDKQKGA